MKFIPKEAIQSIEFDKILSRLKAYCLQQAAAEQFEVPHYFQNIEQLEKELTLVDELLKASVSGQVMPFYHYDDIRQSVENLKVENYVLDLEELIELHVFLKLCSDIEAFFNKPSITVLAPNLMQLWKSVELKYSLPNVISKVISEEGDVRENASPELASIYKKIKTKERQVFKQFDQIAGEYKQLGLLSQTEETIRNGRRVLGVPSEHKRRIEGIIHDESATGKTIFIEPQGAVLLNNEILELELEKRKEIYRILRQLCADLRPFAEQIEVKYAQILRFDGIRSKSLLARELNAEKPKLSETLHIKIEKGRHPLLYLKNKDLGIETVPFSLELDEERRILLISGPNAGGKSITMKAVGLLQMMLQIGCLVPCHPLSQFGLIEQLMCDIGDQQSFEDDLSTYSSRLRNMKDFLEDGNDKTLMLIDEFGSGTDPKMGGSIAQSILYNLNAKRIFGVINTHYSNLKVFAYKTKGIINGAMRFDQEELKPTYELLIGKPGSSFAFEIAEKVGLPNKIIHFAKRNAGKNLRAMDSLINDLQAERQDVEVQAMEFKQKQKQLDKLIKNYDQLHKDLDIQRKKFKLTKREYETNDRIKDRRSLEKLIKQMRAEFEESKEQFEKETEKLAELPKAEATPDLIIQRASEILEETKEREKYVSESVGELKREIVDFELEKLDKELEVGDHVKTINGNMTGKIIRISKKEVVLENGIMEISVPLEDVRPIAEPIRQNKHKAVNTFLASTQNGKIDPSIDIRGYRYKEALLMLEEFFDQAIMSDLDFVKVIHGKGSGTLKKAVYQKLREYPNIKEVRSPEDEDGASGMTYVTF